MPSVKREPSDSPPTSDSALNGKSPKKAKSSPSKGTSGAKSRLPTSAKAIIAEHIINVGVSVVNVDELAEQTGLSKQQIKSQLVANRQNIRKQLLDLAKALQ